MSVLLLGAAAAAVPPLTYAIVPKGSGTKVTDDPTGAIVEHVEPSAPKLLSSLGIASMGLLAGMIGVAFLGSKSAAALALGSFVGGAGALYLYSKESK